MSLVGSCLIDECELRSQLASEVAQSAQEIQHVISAILAMQNVVSNFDILHGNDLVFRILS